MAPAQIKKEPRSPYQQLFQTSKEKSLDGLLRKITSTKQQRGEECQTQIPTTKDIAKEEINILLSLPLILAERDPIE